MSRPGGYLAMLAALAASFGGSRFADSAGRAPREPEVVDEAARERKREKRRQRGARQYAKWLKSHGSSGPAPRRPA